MAAKKTATKKTVTTTKKPAARKPATTKNKKLGKGLDATVFQSAVGQGSAGAEMAYLAAKGEKVPAVKWVPFELVTPDKKEEYQARYKK